MKTYVAPKIGRRFYVRKIQCPNPRYHYYQIIEAETCLKIGDAFKKKREAVRMILSDFGADDAKIALMLASPNGLFCPENIAYNLKKIAGGDAIPVQPL